MVQKNILASGKDYLTVIKSLDDLAIKMGTKWLQGYVEMVSGSAFKLLPGYGIVN
jgi:hypothetical protein